MKTKKYWKSRIAVFLLAAVMAAGTLAGCSYSQEESAAPAVSGSAAAVPAGPMAFTAKEATAAGIAAAEEAAAEEARMAVTNPLTGIGGYNSDAVNVRPAAVVVENDPKARPQWGIDDPEHSPDIIVEGEMEGGETRTLWLYADMTAIPSQIGPIRSARPPYIRFAELFDAIFIHCGLSHSSYDYVGADAVFEQDGVDHINMLTYGEGSLFGRDYSRTSMLEHTAYLRGDKLPGAVKDFGFRTELDTSRFTILHFRGEEEEAAEEEPAPEGLAAELRAAADQIAFPPEPEEPAGVPCTALDLQFSSITPLKHWEYSESDQMYHTQDYYTDVARTNVLLLFDTTTYVTRANTWGDRAEVYTDYGFTGGSGKLAALGRVQDITWTVENGKIELFDEDGETLELAPGKTWIGWCSGNHGGYVNTSE